MQRSAQRVATLAIAAVLGGLGLGLSPVTAHGATYDELQQRVEDAAATYNEAKANLDQIEVEITENEEKIVQIEAELPAQRAKAAESLRTLYKMHQSSNGLIDLVLSSNDFNEFIATLTYLDRIQAKNMTELQGLADLNNQLIEAKDTLNARRAQATQEADRAREAQDEAIAAREEVVRQAAANAAAEQAQVQAVLVKAAQDAAGGVTFTNASGQQTAVEAPAEAPAIVEEAPAQEQTSQEAEAGAPASSGNSDRDSFVNSWTGRIDAYLAGSPLSGHGRTFAEAAWDYGVDPRWSPAISCVESTKGAYCFRPHNAWGWGNSSWGDWDSAIRSHVAGLSSGYGYTLTMGAAQTYSEDWEHWYSAVSAEMSSI